VSSPDTAAAGATATGVGADHPVVELRAVRAAYGRIEVLHGIDMAMAAGTVLALLGPNGAGKSTTLKVVAGLLAPTRGCFHVLGRHVNGVAPDALARAGVCTIPEGRAVFPNLTVAENLRMMTFAGAPRRRVEERAFTRFPRLAERRRQTAGTLSGGEQQMLAMARALSADPAVLLLDEISMGLAPMVVDELYEIVAQVAAEGVAILLTEQFARAALEVATRVALMAHGRIVAEGRPDELPCDLASAYLGGGVAPVVPAGAVPA
jgi:branched-chain amino acid transport system ATP-binding protein